MKQNGSRRALLRRIYGLEVRAANAEAALAAVAIGNGGTLDIASKHLQAIKDDTDLVLQKLGAGLRVIVRHGSQRPMRGYSPISGNSEMTVREIPEDEPEAVVV